MDIAFYATQDIAEGEELTYFYGNLWQQSWDQHINEVITDILQLQKQEAAGATSGEPVSEYSVPSFFTAISPSKSRGLQFPVHWYSVFKYRYLIDDTCDYYMAPSKMKGTGRGVYAGRMLASNSLVEEAPSLLIGNTYLEHWTLKDYVFGSLIPGFATQSSGVSCIYNHNDVLQNVFYFGMPESSREMYGDMDDITGTRDMEGHTYFGTRDNAIMEGMEIYNTYGGDHCEYNSTTL